MQHNLLFTYNLSAAIYAIIENDHLYSAVSDLGIESLWHLVFECDCIIDIGKALGFHFVILGLMWMNQQAVQTHPLLTRIAEQSGHMIRLLTVRWDGCIRGGR